MAAASQLLQDISGVLLLSSPALAHPLWELCWEHFAGLGSAPWLHITSEKGCTSLVKQLLWYRWRKLAMWPRAQLNFSEALSIPYSWLLHHSSAISCPGGREHKVCVRQCNLDWTAFYVYLLQITGHGQVKGEGEAASCLYSFLQLTGDSAFAALSIQHNRNKIIETLDNLA